MAGITWKVGDVTLNEGKEILRQMGEGNYVIQISILPESEQMKKVIDKLNEYESGVGGAAFKERHEKEKLMPPVVERMKKEMPYRFPTLEKPMTVERAGISPYQEANDEEEIGNEVSEDDLMTEEEPMFDVSEDELGESEEVGEEVSPEDLPSDREVVEEIKKDDALGDGRLAGLMDGVQLEASDEKEEDENEEKEDEGEWDGKPATVLVFLKGQYGKIPPHTGTGLGCQRAHAFLSNLDSILQKAIRQDRKGEIDEGMAESLRAQLIRDMAALDQRVQMLRDKRASDEFVAIKKDAGQNCPNCGSVLYVNDEGSSECLMCEGYDLVPGLKMEKGGEKKEENKKEASTNIPTLVVSPFVDAITDILINSRVSAGKNMEEVFSKLAKKYNINDREKLEIVQILKNKGYPIVPLDRGRVGEGNYDQTTEDTVEWIPQYFA